MNDRVAVVTGGGTGIGRAVAELLAGSGYAVHALGLDRDDGLAPAVDFTTVDVTDAEAVLAAVGDVERLHGLVNCAGILRHQNEWQTPDFEAVMRVNVTAAFAIANALLPKLEAGGGSIVNIASMWSFFGSPGAPAYTASKGAIAALTRSQAVAFAPKGVRANAVAPGWVVTRLAARAKNDPARAAAINARIPMGRWAEPAEVATVIRFLLSDDAAYVTGVTLPVDGGYAVA